jgi:hypothetical protein
MRPATLLFALALAPLADASGQQLPLRPGQRVRVTAPSLSLDAYAARFTALRGDTLVLRRGDRTLRCPLTAVTQLEAFRRRRVTAGRVHAYSLGGMALGAMTGALIGGVLCDDSCSPGEWCLQMCPWPGVARGAPIGLGTGLLVGVVMGLAAPVSDRVLIPVDELRMGLTPLRSGHTGLGLSVAF